MIEHSDLVKTLLEINSSQRIVTIPVGMPHGRMEIFKKILRKEPVGKYVLENGRKVVKWNPLSKEEERLIANELGNGVSEYLLQSERKRVLHTILQFLLLDDSVEDKFLRIENLNNSNKETRRRNKIGQNRIVQRQINAAMENQNQNNGYYYQEEARRKAMPFLNEDTIDRLLEKHKNYVYGTYAPTNRTTLAKRLTAKNIANRNTTIGPRKREKEKQIEKLRRDLEKARRNRDRFRERYNYADNNWGIAENHNDHVQQLEEELEAKTQNQRNNPYSLYEDGPFNIRILTETNLAPFRNKELEKMSDIEFERYLRSLRKKGNEKYLPYQGPLVGNLYGNQTV